MAHDVFISYSSNDKTAADAVCASLEARKIRCWIAPRDVLPGIPYGEAIINGINQSRLLVLVFSSSSNNSPQVMREIERAVHKGIAILPLRIDNVMPTKAMEYFVSSSHWLDAMTPPFEKHLQKLGETVQLLLSSEPEKTQQFVLDVTTPKADLEVKWWKKLNRVHIILGSVIIVLIIAGVFFFRSSFDSHNPVSVNTNPPSTTVSQPQATSIPTSSTKEANISVDGNLNDWPSFKNVISDTCGDVNEKVSNEKGLDLKEVWLLYSEDYIYATIQLCGPFDKSAIRNYFIGFDINEDKLIDYDFGMRNYPSPESWVLIFGKTGDKADWFNEKNCTIREVHDIQYKANMDSGILEIAIPRKPYNIPDKVLVQVRVTAGGDSVDSIRMFEVAFNKSK
jgi:hypothetical protein